MATAAIQKRPFYYSSIRKYAILFGDLFSNIEIVRMTQDENGAPELSRERLPIAYGPKEKFYVRTTEDPDLLKTKAIKLPRLGFEIKSMQYDPARKLNNYRKFKHSSTPTDQGFQYTPTPYNFNFGLYLIAKNQQEATQVVEQIVPFFNPDVTVTLNMMPFLDHELDVPVVLNSVIPSDTYSGDFGTRREIVWEFDFTLKAYIYGPTRGAKVIRRTDVNYFDIVKQVLIANQHGELTHPTIPRDQITEEDDYGFEETYTEIAEG